MKPHFTGSTLQKRSRSRCLHQFDMERPEDQRTKDTLDQESNLIRVTPKKSTAGREEERMGEMKVSGRLDEEEEEEEEVINMCDDPGFRPVWWLSLK